MDVARAFFIAGTIPLIVAGGLHVLLTLTDTARPTHFAPRDAALQPALEATPIRFGGRRAPAMWSAWLGFNISHGLGVFTFGLLCLLIAAQDYTVVDRIDAIRPLTVVFPLAYLALSLRFWFRGPALITATSTACFAVAAVLSL